MMQTNVIMANPGCVKNSPVAQWIRASAYEAEG